MRLYSYVVARDFGFAPNPFYGYCTLATCKPKIRSTASIGDWIVGTGSKAYDLGDHLVYAMFVTEVCTFDEYWDDERFRHKRPNLRGSVKQWFGDNIYHRDPNTRRWRQENSHHSKESGTTHRPNVLNDTQTDRVFISNDFVYFGGSGPRLPARFLREGHELVKRGPGHKCNFSERYVDSVVAWLRSLNAWGCAGDPAEFSLVTWG